MKRLGNIESSTSLRKTCVDEALFRQSLVSKTTDQGTIPAQKFR